LTALRCRDFSPGKLHRRRARARARGTGRPQPPLSSLFRYPRPTVPPHAVFPFFRAPRSVRFVAGVHRRQRRSIRP
jgi:hypothetical protein